VALPPRLVRRWQVLVARLQASGAVDELADDVGVDPELGAGLGIVFESGRKRIAERAAEGLAAQSGSS
jgi:hypothetical protein